MTFRDLLAKLGLLRARTAAAPDGTAAAHPADRPVAEMFEEQRDIAGLESPKIETVQAVRPSK